MTSASGSHGGSEHEWTMSQEREFIETLLCQRFNFYLVVFAAIIAGVVAAEQRIHLMLVLWIGSILCWSLTATLARAQYKLDITLAFLSKVPSHPTRITDRLAGKRFTTRRLVGYYIPVGSSTVLTALTIASQLGWLVAKGECK